MTSGPPPTEGLAPPSDRAGAMPPTCCGRPSQAPPRGTAGCPSKAAWRGGHAFLPCRCSSWGCIPPVWVHVCKPQCSCFGLRTAGRHLFLLMSTSRQDLYCCFLLLTMSAMFPLCFCPCTLCSALTACPLPRLPHPILITSTHSVSGKEAPPADERVSMWLQSSLCILCLMPNCWWNNKAVKNCMRCAHEGRCELPGKCMVPSYLPA